MQGKGGLFDRLLYCYSFLWKTLPLIVSRHSYLNRSKTHYIMGLLGCRFAIKQKKSQRTLWMVITAAHSCAISVLLGRVGENLLILPPATLTGCNLCHFPPAHHWEGLGRGFEARRSDHFWVKLFLLNLLLLVLRVLICQKIWKMGRLAAHSPLPS